MREVSIAADLNPGYLHSVIGKDQKEPTVTRLARVCKVLDVSLAYVMYGVDISPETEELLHIIESRPEKRDQLLKLLAD